MIPKVISFGTNNDHYSRCIENLKYDCKINELPHRIEKIQSWSVKKNEITIYKPTFIKKLLKEEQTPLLWLDVDSRIEGSVTIKNREKSDVGVSANPFESRLNKSENDINHLFSGGVFLFRPTENAIRFLDTWEELSKKVFQENGYGDHACIDEAILQHYKDTSFTLLTNELNNVVLYGGNGKRDFRIPK